MIVKSKSYGYFDIKSNEHILVQAASLLRPNYHFTGPCRIFVKATGNVTVQTMETRGVLEIDYKDVEPGRCQLMVKGTQTNISRQDVYKKIVKNLK